MRSRLALILSLSLTGCVPSGPSEIDAARSRVSVAIAVMEVTRPPCLPNDFENKSIPAVKQGSSDRPAPSPRSVDESHDPASLLGGLHFSEVLCVTIAGVDYDLDDILKDYRTDWTWPGMTEESLREHLAGGPHRVTGIDELPFATVKKLHAALHEREERQAKAAQPKSAPRLNCPGGVCPQPQYQIVPQYQRRGLFGRWRR